MLLNKQWYGASWKVMGFACYAGLNAISRYLSGGAETALERHLPVPELVFLQDLIALFILLPWILKQPKISFFPPHFKWHFFRVVTSVVAIMAWYAVLMYMPLAQAVALSIIGPMLGVVGARWILKESLGMTRLLFILLSIIAAFYFLHPEKALIENKTNQYGLFFLFISAAFFALAKIATRKLAQKGVSAQALTSYLFIFIVPFSFIPALTTWVTPSFLHLPWLLLAGALTALAIFCVSNALVHAEVSFLAPFDICQFFLNTIVGYVAFMELPAPWAIWLLIAFIGFSFFMKRRE